MIKKLLTSAAAGLALLALALLPTPAPAAQGSGCMPTTGTVSGLTLVQDINAGIAALISTNSGATAPATDCTALPIKGQLWLDTSTTPAHLRIYDGVTTNWLDLGAVNAVTHVWEPPIGGGSGTVASATTTDLCSITQGLVAVSGVTTITSFSNTCITGQVKFLTFSGILTLTHNASSLILPNGGSNITTAAGDRAVAVYLGSGNWEVLNYTRADGTTLSSTSIFTGAVFFNGAISPTAISGNTNDWAPTGLSAANVIRLSCSGAFNITGLTAPATDGKILVLDNIGATNNCTLTSQDAASTAANRFAFDRPITLRPGRTLTIIYDLTTARWRLWQEVTAQPIAGGFKTLKLTNDATSATTLKNNFVLTADEITVEDVNGGAARLSTVNCSADVTASGAAGLDTGTVAQNTWYFFWVAYNPTTNAQSCFWSLQTAAASTTKPSGYTFIARAGAAYTNATSAGCTFNSANSACFSRTLQYGRTAKYVITASSATVSMPRIVSGTSGSPTVPTWTAAAITAAVPTTASVAYVIGGTTSGDSMVAAPNNSYGAITSATTPPPIRNPGTNLAAAVPFQIEGSNFYYASTGTGGYLDIYGWEDNL